MRVDVRFHGIERSGALAEYATRRVHQHLSRFGGQVRGVSLRLSDENGPRGGNDKRCQIAAKGRDIGTLHLSQTQADLYAGVDVALARFAHVIGRALERARTRPAVAGARHRS